MPTLVSLNVGMPRDVGFRGETVHTGAWKYPVAGARLVRRLGVEGDGQGDTYGHGGPNRAVLVYQVESYRYWERQLRRDHLPPGSFAENLTVTGLDDQQVCIGDRYRIGEAEFEVSQPRVTCFRAGLRIGEPQLAALLVAHHRPGFYMRVLTEGRVRAGDEIVRTAEGPGRVSVAAVDALLYLPDRDPDTLRRAVRIPALSPGWQDSLRQLLEGSGSHRSGARLDRVPARCASPTSCPRARPSPRSTSPIPTDGPCRRPAPASTSRCACRPGCAATRCRPPRVPTAYRISVKREPQGVVSGYVHAALRSGADIEAAAPRGDFVLDDRDAPVVLVSAGIGITPVLAMLHELAESGSAREVWWLHADRRPDDEPFATETRALLARLPRVHARSFHSAGPSGRLTADRIAELGLPADAGAYVCGPATFMTDMAAALRAAGLVSVHSETFGTLAASRPGIVDRARRAPHVPDGPAGDGPIVTFTRSGVSAPFDDRGSLLEFAEACDVPARWQCRSGVCRTCETPLLAGEVDYAPAPLEAPAPGTVLLCCARPRTELVVDM